MTPKALKKYAVEWYTAYLMCTSVTSMAYGSYDEPSARFSVETATFYCIVSSHGQVQTKHWTTSTYILPIQLLVTISQIKSKGPFSA